MEVYLFKNKIEALQVGLRYDLELYKRLQLDVKVFVTSKLLESIMDILYYIENFIVLDTQKKNYKKLYKLFKSNKVTVNEVLKIKRKLEILFRSQMDCHNL